MNKSQMYNVPSAKTTIGILVSLVGVNAVWVVISRFSGPLIGLIIYVFVAFLCWKRERFETGVIAGMLGFAIHTYELLFQRTGKLTGIDMGFLVMNIVLPISLAFFGYRAYREKRRTCTEI
jgi:hypothetical protein